MIYAIAVCILSINECQIDANVYAGGMNRAQCEEVARVSNAHPGDGGVITKCVTLNQPSWREVK